MDSLQRTIWGHTFSISLLLLLLSQIPFKLERPIPFDNVGEDEADMVVLVLVLLLLSVLFQLSGPYYHPPFIHVSREDL